MHEPLERKDLLTDISNLLREYIDTPKEELLTKIFDHDHWGLVNEVRLRQKQGDPDENNSL